MRVLRLSYGMPLAVSLSLASDLHMEREAKLGVAAPTYSDTLAAGNREEVERERRDIEQTAEKLLDHDAMASLDDTWNAVRAIEQNRISDARRLLQQALEKIRYELARDPARVSVPVGLEVSVVDVAPADRERVLDLADQAALAMAKRMYSEAREVLQQLASEIRVQTPNLQLRTFADSLNKAVQLMNKGQNSESTALLRSALASVVPSNRVVPIPLIMAREAIREAEVAQQHNKQEALNLLEKAEQQIQRAKDLGYLERAHAFDDLGDQITQLKKQLKSGSLSVFAHLKAMIAGRLKE